MNWFIHILQKEARGRRFGPNDRVRYFTEGLKGKGRGVVVTPRFSKGTVVEYNSDLRRYRVKHDDGSETDVHPRNIVPDTMKTSPVPAAPVIESPEPMVEI